MKIDQPGRISPFSIKEIGPSGSNVESQSNEEKVISYVDTLKQIHSKPFNTETLLSSRSNSPRMKLI
jgi:hypothetical protein